MPPIDDAMIRRFYRDVGSRVRAARTGAHWTQDALAESLDLSRSSIANLEGGRQRIPLHLLALIAELLQVELASLLPQRSISDPIDEFSNVDETLADIEKDSRDFIVGAIAQLRAEVKGGEST